MKRGSSTRGTGCPMPNFCTRFSCLSSPAIAGRESLPAIACHENGWPPGFRRPSTTSCLRSTPPDRDGAGDGARPGAHGVTVIAGLDDPLAVFLADDLADMM